MPIGVVYKFFDDQGGYLAAVLTYYAFVAIFPLLLIASSVLGFVLQGHPALQEEILSSALAQFPIVGDQLGRPEGIQGSTSAAWWERWPRCTAWWGSGKQPKTQSTSPGRFPRNSRLNPVVSRLRSLALARAGGSRVWS